MIYGPYTSSPNQINDKTGYRSYMEVVGYCRLSPTGKSKKERERKLKKQEEKIKDHCRAEGKTWAKIFSAPRASARKLVPAERETFQEMIEYLQENPEIEEIIVHHYDRTTRVAVIGLALKEYIEAMIWTPEEGTRNIEVYSTSHEEYFESLTDLDQVSAGDLFGALADFHADQKSKKDEADKAEEVVNDRQNDYQPHGPPPTGLQTNRVAFSPDDDIDESIPSDYYLPDDVEEFKTAIKILNRYDDYDGSAYQLGKELGIESNPGNTVKAICRNKWKYLQAHQAAKRVDVVPDPVIEFEAYIDEEDRECLKHIPE